MVLFLRLSPATWRGFRGVAGLVWLSSFGLLTSCAPEQAAPNGSIEGTLLPAGGVTSVTATAADGQTYQAVPDPTTGQVRFASLPAGTYTLSFTTILAYHTPAPVTVQLGAGTTARPAFAGLTRDAKLRGTLRWTIGNATYSTSQVVGEVNSSLLSFSGVTTALGASHHVLLVLPATYQGQPIFQGVGTYRMGARIPLRVLSTRSGGRLDL